ncbi:unnamed protein product [Adineta steineri]|nr:unnamed protein product [Adineta steineri]
MDLISLLQANLGFIPNIQLAPSGVTYDELMEMIPNVYDIVVADTTVTPARREVVDFSQGFFSNGISILMLTNPAVQIDLLAFLKPFSTSLCLLILGAILCSSIIICLIERQDKEELKEQSIISLCAMSVWYSYGNVIGYGAGIDLQTGPARILTVGLYMLSIVLVASHTANLASDLTIQNSQSPISGLDDIKAGKIPFNRLGIQVGTAYEDFYSTEISNNQTNFYPLYSKQQLYDSLLNGTIDAAFIGSGTAQYITSNVYCNISVVGESFDQGIFAIATPKQWIYQRSLDIAILTLSVSGDLNNLETKWFQSQLCPTSSTSTSTAMNIQSLAGLFLVFCSYYYSIITVICIEKMSYY